MERSRQNLATGQSRIPAESAASGQKVAAPYLVVGADSLVGGSLIKALQSAGQGVVGTTRRRASMGPGRFYLDFQNSESYRLPVPASYAFIVAAATNYDRCETDPSARKINVEQTPRLVESLLSQGLFVTLISTNSVFGGERAWPHEEDPHDARIAYAIQKHEAEKDAFAAAKANSSFVFASSATCSASNVRCIASFASCSNLAAVAAFALSASDTFGFGVTANE